MAASTAGPARRMCSSRLRSSGSAARANRSAPDERRQLDEPDVEHRGQDDLSVELGLLLAVDHHEEAVAHEALERDVGLALPFDAARCRHLVATTAENRAVGLDEADEL